MKQLKKDSDKMFDNGPFYSCAKESVVKLIDHEQIDFILFLGSTGLLLLFD